MIPTIIIDWFKKTFCYGDDSKFYAGCLKGEKLIGCIAIPVIATLLVVLGIKDNAVDTYTIVDNKTDTKYENARFACLDTRDCQVECPENPKPIYTPLESGRVELKIGGKKIMLSDWDKIDFKRVNQREYCNN